MAASQITPALPATVNRIMPLIRHNRRAVLLTLAVALVAALAIYLSTPRRFVAEADVWLDRGAPGGAAAGNGAAEQTARETELRLLQSSSLAARVVDRLGLQDVRGFGRADNGAPAPAGLARRTAVEAVRARTQLSTRDGSDAVTVGISAGDPLVATAVANQLVETYVEDRRVNGAGGREVLQARADEAVAREAMIRSEAALAALRGSAALSREPVDAAAVRAEAAAIDAAAAVALSAQRAAERRLSRLTGERDRKVAAGASADAADPRVRRMAEEVAALRERAALLTTARQRAAWEVQAGAQVRRELARLQRDARSARQRYDALARVAKQREATRDRDRRMAYVIARASPDDVSRRPDPLLFAVLALLAASAAAALVVVLLELRHKGFRTAPGLARMLGVPVVGAVPRVAGLGDAASPDNRMAAPDYLCDHPNSALSAAIRDVSAGLRLGRDASAPRVVAVCSALPEEGKTTVSICLARSAAIAGLRVLLVDCDARRPAASQALAPDTAIGLTEVFEDGVDYRQALQSDSRSGARFLAQSPRRRLASGVMGASAMKGLLEQVQDRFDLIVLDTPPALALAESREIAAMADRVLLVARYRRTPKDAVKIANDLLGRANARVSAAALTMVEA